MAGILIEEGWDLWNGWQGSTHRPLCETFDPIEPEHILILSLLIFAGSHALFTTPLPVARSIESFALSLSAEAPTPTALTNDTVVSLKGKFVRLVTKAFTTLPRVLFIHFAADYSARVRVSGI